MHNIKLNPKHDLVSTKFTSNLDILRKTLVNITFHVKSSACQAYKFGYLDRISIIRYIA